MAVRGFARADDYRAGRPCSPAAAHRPRAPHGLVHARLPQDTTAHGAAPAVQCPGSCTRSVSPSRCRRRGVAAVAAAWPGHRSNRGLSNAFRTFAAYRTQPPGGLLSQVPPPAPRAPSTRAPAQHCTDRDAHACSYSQSGSGGR